MRPTTIARPSPPPAKAAALVAASFGNADMEGGKPAAGILLGRDAAIDAVAADFIATIAQHRHWSRELKAQVPA